MQQPAATKSPQTQTKTGGRCITFAVLYNKNFLSVDGLDSYSGNYGSGTISYKGVRDPSNPEFTCWVFSLYGGIQIYEDSASKSEISNEIGAITFPENLALQAKYGLIEET